MLRIGVLLPRSSLFPAFGLDILNGIKCCLKQNNISNNFTFITDNIGFGVDEAEVYTKAEKLLLQEDVDVAVVVADLHIAELLGPLFTASKKILLMVNMGTGIPESWKPAPTTIIHSLNLSMHVRLTGKLAAQENENKKGVYVLSYYDAGYRQTYSMLNSHQQNGGEPVLTHVTHIKKEEFTLVPVEQFLSDNADVKTLLCLFTGDMADQFCDAIKTLQEKFQLSIYASPMLLEAYREKFSEQQLEAFAIKGYTCWLPELETEANTVFKTAFKKTANKEATLFGVLGWDTGLLLKDILEQKNHGDENAPQIISALCNKVYESPRGWMKLDAATFFTYGSSWLINCTSIEKTKQIQEYKATEEEWENFTSENFPPDSHSGWRNTYLCI
jgi:branched-chain amino acid transport system substrate-binding protein